MTAYTIDDLVAKYIELRDMQKALKKKHDAELAPVNDLMAQLEAIFLSHMNTHGMESFSTPHGTPYRSTATTISVYDWDKFYPWVVETANEGMLTRGANKTAVEAFIEIHKQQPPGLNISRTYVCNVRRKNA